MCRLAETYRIACRDAMKGEGLAPAELEAALSEAYRAGCAAHPDLSIGDEAFVAYLARCGARVAAGAPGMHAGDLFIACAALAGEARAVGELRAKHRPVVARYLRPIDTTAPFLEEVEQRLWADLLVAAPGRSPKLAGYTGGGPLMGFVGVCAQRIALGIRRAQAVEARAVGAAGADLGIRADDELAFIKRRYREAFQRAVQEALRVLDDRELAIFRMHFVDGLTTRRIAELHKVSQPTVSRWLAQGRQRVLEKTRVLLQARLQVPETEFDSLAGLLISQLDLSVTRGLAPR